MAEMTESMKEKTEKFDRERQQMQEKNKELMRSVDQLTSQLEETAGNTRRQEQELQDLRQNKELLSQVGTIHVIDYVFDYIALMQWERQIADIIQLVSEEKTARSYLQSVAKKLVDDVEGLKGTALTLGRVS